jgi:hypothetical protein
VEATAEAAAEAGNGGTPAGFADGRAGRTGSETGTACRTAAAFAGGTSGAGCGEIEKSCRKGTELALELTLGDEWTGCFFSGFAEDICNESGKASFGSPFMACRESAGCGKATSTFCAATLLIAEFGGKPGAG